MKKANVRQLRAIISTVDNEIKSLNLKVNNSVVAISEEISTVLENATVTDEESQLPKEKARDIFIDTCTATIERAQ